MTPVVPLQVENVDIDDHTTENILAKYFSDALWATVDGVTTATITLPKRQTGINAVAYAHRIERCIPGARVRRVHRELVSTSDIAARTGVSREAARKWARRPGFPDAVGSVGGTARPSKVWWWTDVAAWLDATFEMRLTDPDMVDHATVTRIESTLAISTPGQWHPADPVDLPEPADLYPRTAIKTHPTVLVPEQSQTAWQARTTDELIRA